MSITTGPFGGLPDAPCVRAGLVARDGGRGSRAGEPTGDAVRWPLASGSPGLATLGVTDAAFTVPVGLFTACGPSYITCRQQLVPK